MTDSKTAMVVRVFDPINLEYPFETLNSFVTPSDEFYVRNHFPEPVIDAHNWQLSVEGKVDKPFCLTLEEIKALPAVTMHSLLECAGNSRVFLVPKVAGAQWGAGAVGNAKWTGVMLSTILERAGISAGAVDVVFEGADEGIPDETPKPKRPIHYARSVPVDDAKKMDILLAYEMNGEPLSQSHGFPLRAIVPGWYGMASVKWLSRLVVTDYPFDGYFQKIDYAYWEDRDGLSVRVPITEMEVKAEIARPTAHEKVTAGQSFTISGAAWAGKNKIAKVEISTDGGACWSNATLSADDSTYTWALWKYEWKVPTLKAGTLSREHVVMARATDTAGNTQPMERDLARDTYRISHVLPVPVRVI